MVSKNLIKDLCFNTIEDYFQYIIDNISNSQAKVLFKELSKKQKLDFYHYIDQSSSIPLIKVLDAVNL